jgi:hypothetical protein
MLQQERQEMLHLKSNKELVSLEQVLLDYLVSQHNLIINKLQTQVHYKLH